MSIVDPGRVGGTVAVSGSSGSGGRGFVLFHELATAVNFNGFRCGCDSTTALGPGGGGGARVGGANAEAGTAMREYAVASHEVLKLSRLTIITGGSGLDKTKLGLRKHIVPLEASADNST